MLYCTVLYYTILYCTILYYTILHYTTLTVLPCTLHPAPCTLHPTPYTLHPTPYTLHLKPFPLNPEQGVRAWLKRNLKVSIPIYYGWKGTPFPHPVPLCVAIGQPISVPQVCECSWISFAL